MLITLPTLSVFTMVFVLTGGGPGNESETLPVFMYRYAFRQHELGYGTAISVILLAIGAVLALLYVAALRPGREDR
jgi:multiple sugar transport system permease protein